MCNHLSTILNCERGRPLLCISGPCIPHVLASPVTRGSYFNPDPFNISDAASWTDVDAVGYKTRSPHIMNPNDTAILVEAYCYSRSQIVVGVGLSSYSFMGFPRTKLMDCVATGFLLDGPTCNTSLFEAVYASTPGSHSSIGGGGHLPYRWDEIAADVAAGRAVQGSSPMSFRRGYGEVQGTWLFYPSASDPEIGELTFWCGCPHWAFSSFAASQFSMLWQECSAGAR